jgi:hypothetical protein
MAQPESIIANNDTIVGLIIRRIVTTTLAGALLFTDATGSSKGRFADLAEWREVSGNVAHYSQNALDI